MDAAVAVVELSVLSLVFGSEHAHLGLLPLCQEGVAFHGLPYGAG